VTQNFFTLEPRDAMLVRDGRAMNASVGRGVLFPPPSTLAGLVRTRLGRDATGGFDAGRIPDLLKVTVWGPLLARLTPDGLKVADLLFTPPGDCVWFRDDARGTFGRRLAPRPVREIVPGAITDLGDVVDLPAFQDGIDTRAKPVSHPLLWSRESLFAWLGAPRDFLPEQEVKGLKGLDRERRHHIAIDPATGTVEEGALFGTEGVRMSHRRTVDDRHTFERYAFLAAWSGAGALPKSFVPLGGERRGAFLDPCPEETAQLLAPPPWLDRIRGGSRARVLLATPAIFAQGAVPPMLRGARVIAARVDRPDVVSGWSFEHRAPKPTRRLAPAGSVYWVEVPDDAWARSVWMSNVSDDPQDCRDGFGLALLGAA
jgi:CRISPR-associated protein Cmr3